MLRELLDRIPRRKVRVKPAAPEERVAGLIAAFRRAYHELVDDGYKFGPVAVAEVRAAEALIARHGLTRPLEVARWAMRDRVQGSGAWRGWQHVIRSLSGLGRHWRQIEQACRQAEVTLSVPASAFVDWHRAAVGKLFAVTPAPPPPAIVRALNDRFAGPEPVDVRRAQFACLWRAEQPRAERMTSLAVCLADLTEWLAASAASWEAIGDDWQP